MDLTHSITDKLFTQCINLVGSDENQQKMRTKIIDPLVAYFKYRLRYFFMVIIVLLCCILITNMVMIGYFVNMRMLVKVNQLAT